MSVMTLQGAMMMAVCLSLMIVWEMMVHNLWIMLYVRLKLIIRFQVRFCMKHISMETAQVMTMMN